MDQHSDPGSQSWRPSPRHISRLHRVPLSVTCTPKRPGDPEGSPLSTSWRGRTTTPLLRLPRLHFTATPPPASTPLLWTPTDPRRMAAFSLWAAGPPVRWCSCPLAPGSAPLCTRPVITIWKPLQPPSTGERQLSFSRSPEWGKEENCFL